MAGKKKPLIDRIVVGLELLLVLAKSEAARNLAASAPAPAAKPKAKRASAKSAELPTEVQKTTKTRGRKTKA